METFSFRYDEKVKKELDFIKAHLNSNQSQAIKDAIHTFYEYLKMEEKAKLSPLEILKESGFIGCFKGEKNLSTTYKEQLTKRIKAKHGPSPRSSLCVFEPLSRL
jgi:hypothetical protein